jgi:hypothetical protein
MNAASEVLGAMITPAVLISASGTLVLSTSNCLPRVVDRVWALASEAERMRKEEASPEARRAIGSTLQEMEFLGREVARDHSSSSLPT